MNLDNELMKQGHLTRIQSTAFKIYLVKIQDKTYFCYFPKQECQNRNHINEFLTNDMQQQNEIKYLRKLNKIGSQSFYAFESYKVYNLLSELKQLQEQVILKIFQDLLMALYTIHQKGLLGRCFNVHNILIVENQYSVMMEYGFYPDLEYEVPELIYNQIYNEKIDIFLLGRVIFYLMVGNDLPKYNMKNLNEVSSDINLSIAQTNYSESLKKLVIQMLTIDVNKRIDYLQLFSKFKNNQFYSHQEQFYKQNTLKSITQKIIEKREKKSNINLDESTAFEIQQTSNFTKMIKDSQIKTSQNLLSDKSTIDSSQTDCLNLILFDPPESEDYQNYKSLNQDQIISKVNYQPQTQTLSKTKYDTEEIKINNSPFENDILLSVLPFLNSDRPQDQYIWNQIYFQLYRFSLMTKLIEELESHLQQCNKYLIVIAIYGMKKAQIILKKEYQISLEQCKNLYSIPTQEWERFTLHSAEYKRMISKIKFDIDVNQRLLLQKDYIQLQKILDQNKNEGVLKDLYKFIENYLNDNKEINNFDDIKRSYRYILTNTLSFFETQDDNNYPYVKLLIMMCILINRICDIQSIPLHFKTICKFLNINQINSIVQIEQFLKKAKKQEYAELFEELKQCYFSG
ncbi:unnamed protein product [Paramecium primaurelia]|uniref:Protein kinase domain-containing protein n=1 Tax=Paramecium primaurelia TaxID=5886 RepID=A0A8S1MLK4_PARPR|nr:unnamed protein product [Paramecium primaurelia]